MQQWEVMSGCNRKVARALMKSAISKGATLSDWRVSFEPIYARDWLGIETLHSGEWKEWTSK